MSEMKPFKCSCGGKAIHHGPNAHSIANGDNQGSVQCKKCGLCVSCEEDSMGESIEKWNQLQSYIPLVRARIGELEKEIAPFRDPYFKGLSMSAIAELAKKSIRLTEQHSKDKDRLSKLEEALEEAQGAGK